MSPHRITVSQGQSSPNSGTKCRLTRPLTLPNFVRLRREVCEISAVENLLSPETWTEVHQNPLKVICNGFSQNWWKS